MKISIRAKLLFYMAVLIIIFTVVLLGFNLVFTRSFYIEHKKSVLLEASGKIERLLEGSEWNIPPELEFELNRLERSEGASVFISLPDDGLYYPIRPFPDGMPTNDPFLPFDTGEQESDAETSFFTIVNDPNMGFETLRFQAKLSNGIEILIWLPMDEISGSIDAFNMIIVFATLIVLICSVFWSLFISQRFTKPIKQINLIAKKIAARDFSEKITVKGCDEIAQLSESINELSGKLSNAITQLSEKNLQLEKDIIYEKKLDKMRKMFVSNVSHELKTPIFLIQGYAEGLKKVGHREAKREYYCNVIMSESEKMDKLIKDLLDLAQIESGMFGVKSQPFNIVTLTEDALYKFQPIFEHREINVTVNFPEALTVIADPGRTEQVIANYLNNAIDHLDANNEITVTVSEEDNAARISVYNSGGQIPEDSIDKVWVSFYKADESRAREYGGTGLGLSIVKAIQKGQGGGYGVTNKDGGVEFWITLAKL